MFLGYVFSSFYMVKSVVHDVGLNIWGKLTSKGLFTSLLQRVAG